MQSSCVDEGGKLGLVCAAHGPKNTREIAGGLYHGPCRCLLNIENRRPEGLLPHEA